MEPAQPTPTLPVRIEPRIRAYLERPLFAAVATLDPDGAPRQAFVWYRLEADDRILVNSRAGRRWPANLERDGRVAIAITSPDGGEEWVGVTGHVVDIDADLERARDDIVALAHHYRSDPTEASIAEFRSQRRISFRIAIDSIHNHLED
jgi:PPOX class probable F420-dependent enzyme